MPTLQELLAAPYNTQKPGQQLADIQQAGLQQRNLALQSIMSQYNRPLTNVYAAGGVDSLVGQLRSSRQSTLEQLASRGLNYSGAAPTAERSMRDLYSRGLLDVALGANSQEQARKSSLMQQLQGVVSSDLDFQNTLANASIQGTQADYATQIAQLSKNLELAHGSAILASILVGGAAGAAGGAAGSTVGGASGISGGAATGAAGYGGAGLGAIGVGALGGMNFANQFGGGGGPMSAAGPTQGFDTAGPSSYGGKPVTTMPSGYNLTGNAAYMQRGLDPEFQALLMNARSRGYLQ